MDEKIISILVLLYDSAVYMTIKKKLKKKNL